MAVPSDPTFVDGIGLGIEPKQQRGIDVRNRLVEAALEEFAENGVSQSKVENIVARAGTSWGTFFRYFPRKEDVLLFASVGVFRDQIKPLYERGLADRDMPIRDTALEMFTRMLSPWLTPQLHAETIVEMVGHPFRFAAILGEGEQPIVGLLANLMIEGQERGEIRQDKPAAICAGVVAAGVIFSSIPVLRAVAAGHLPNSQVLEVASTAFEVAWTGIEARPD